jgi:hypothetical protein
VSLAFVIHDLPVDARPKLRFTSPQLGHLRVAPSITASTTFCVVSGCGTSGTPSFQVTPAATAAFIAIVRTARAWSSETPNLKGNTCVIHFARSSQCMVRGVPLYVREMESDLRGSIRCNDGRDLDKHHLHFADQLPSPTIN